MRNKLIISGIVMIILFSAVSLAQEPVKVEQSKGQVDREIKVVTIQPQVANTLPGKPTVQILELRAQSYSADQNTWASRAIALIAEWALYFQDRQYSFLTAMHWTGKTSQAHQNKVDKLFADTILGGIDSWTSSACKRKVSQTRGATSVAFDLRTESQSAWINGEKSEFTRPDGSRSYVYKVAWTVIPKPKCNMQYNIRLNNQVPTYPNDFTMDNGAQSHYGSYVDVINRTDDYREVCISFSSNDNCVVNAAGNPVADLCNDFVKK